MHLNKVNHTMQSTSKSIKDMLRFRIHTKFKRTGSYQWNNYLSALICPMVNDEHTTLKRPCTELT